MSRAAWAVFAAWYATWCYAEWQRAASDLRALVDAGARGLALVPAVAREDAAWRALGLGDGRGDWWEREAA